MQGRKRTQLTVGTLAAVGSLLMPGAVSAHEADAPANPNSGRVSLTLGVDATTSYFFRGFAQENSGLILQPYAFVGFKIHDGNENFGNVVLTAGIWNSFQEEGTLGTTTNDSWYEADLSVGLSATILEKITASITYIAYTYPNGGAGATVSEFDLSVGYDDTGVWPEIFGQEISLQPYVLIAFEIDNQADAGGVTATMNEGIYVELGVTPSFTIIESEQHPVTLDVPIKVGLSANDYYENRTAGSTGSDETFGFFSVGFIASVPISCVPADFGKWTLSGGVTLLIVDESIANSNTAITSANQFQTVGTVGVKVEY